MGRELENIDLTVSQRKEIAALLKRYLPNTEVWAYGSRVRFTARPTSDLDMVAFSSKEQSLAVSNLNEAFEESSLPFRVDLFIWDEVPEQFHKNIEDERVVLQEKAEDKELPEGWEERTLGDVIITNDANYSKKDKWNFINYLDTGNLTENQISEFQYLTVGVDKVPSRAKRKVQPGDIVFSTVRPNNKHYGILKNPTKNLLVSTGFVTIRAKKEEADTNFIYWYLVQSEIIERLQTIGEQSTSNYPSIKPSDIEELEINLPPLPEQKAIAHFLGSLDDKIELNRRMNKTLETMAQALFKSWFIDFDPVLDNAILAGNPIPDELEKRAEIRRAMLAQNRLPDSIRQLFPNEFEHTEEMGWIPRGWKVSAVGDFLNRMTVKKRYKKNDVTNFGLTPVYEQGTNILLGYHDNQAEIFASIEDPVFIFGDHTCVMKISAEPFSISENVIPLKGKLHNTCWVYYAVKDKQKFEEYRRHWMELIIKPVISPKSNLSDSFEKLVSKNLIKQQDLSHQILTLSNLRNTLLPQLLSGKILIPEAEKLVEAISIRRDEL